MMLTVLRLPQNTFCHNDFLYLHTIGGPKLRSITAACSAALIRSAVKTTPGWRGWIEQLSNAATRFLPLEPLVRDTLTLCFWDSSPVALFLRRASLGLPSHPHFDMSSSDLIRRTSMQDDLGKFPVQKLVYNELISIEHVNCIHVTLHRRLEWEESGGSV